MLSTNAQSDLFELVFPDTFFIPEVCEKYDVFLKQKPMVFDNIRDVLLESIQSFDSPEFGTTPIVQNSINGNSAGEDILQASKESVQKTTDRTFTITFRHTDGFITYFLLLELYFKRYEFGTDSSRKPFGKIILETLLTDNRNTPICRVYYDKCMLTNVPSLNLSYASQAGQFGTFTCTFSYSLFSTGFVLPKLKLTT